MDNDFLSRVRRFGNDFHEWRSPSCLTSDKNVIHGDPHIRLFLTCFFLYPIHTNPLKQSLMAIGIDHDTVCAGVVGTAIRHSTRCAGRRAAACGRAGRHNEYKWSISILPRSQFYKKQGKLAFSTSCTAVRPHRRLRNDAWRRDS